jgi:hypothetical protein
MVIESPDRRGWTREVGGWKRKVVKALQDRVAIDVVET